MANQKSFNDIAKAIRERREFFRKSKEALDSKLCSCCKQKVSSNGGPSRVEDVCNNCVSKSLNGSE